ncbi:MAG: hypothetical protein M3Y24_05775 [Acidobacteriota bacterium]|nr:hypothetical protein [Acidobacteriota bacterium]
MPTETRIDLLQGTLDLTASGRKQLDLAADDWARLTAAIGRVMELA